MTQRQILLVQRTWKVFRGISPEIVGDAFYSKLFAEMPALKRMFKNTMTNQYKKLVDMMSVIVGRLQHLEEITGELQQMAKRHVDYGVKQAHYHLVGQALLWTLEQGLGPDWNEETKQAWSQCYDVIAGTMISASGY